METGVVFRRGPAQSLGCAAPRGPDRCTGGRCVRAEAGGRAGDHSLPWLEEEICVVRVLWVRRSWRGPPALVMRCRRRLTSRGVVLRMGVFGPGGVAALLLVSARPVPRILLRGTILHQAGLPVRVALLHPVVIVSSGVGVSWPAERSAGARLAVLRPARVVPASSSGGMRMVRAVTPVPVRTVIRVRGPAVEPRRPEQRSSGLAFWERGAHRSLSTRSTGEVSVLEAGGRVKEKKSGASASASRGPPHPLTHSAPPSLLHIHTHSITAARSRSRSPIVRLQEP